jgi:uncharacterized Zn-binding protein involved in type VI secretion
MGRPAARVGDMHTCPQWDGHHPHVGGPIAAGAGNVLINGRPAARIGDMATCQAPPDAIASGAGNVLIAGRPAARLGDGTVHGGVVVAGSGNVMITDGSGGSAPSSGCLQMAAAAGAPFLRF